MVLIKIPNFPNQRVFGRIVPLIIPLALIILTYALPQKDIKSLIVFLFLIFVFSIYKFDSRILIAYGLLLLLITALLTLGKANDIARQIAVLSYWVLSSGVVCFLIEFYRNKRYATRETAP